MSNDTTTTQEQINSIDSLSNKKNVAKADLRRIEISEITGKLPDLKNSRATKDNLIAGWLTNWIDSSLSSGKVDKNDLLPKKNVLAKFFGVSIGTVQTAIRLIEDKGYVESKQRIGTFIKDREENDSELRKQTSKRDQAILAIKHLITKNEYKIDEPLPSSRELAKIIGSAPNTTRLALEFLSGTGVIEAMGCRGNKANWILKQIPDMQNESSDIALETDTLVDQVERDLKEFIDARCQVNDKLPSHFELADTLKVSIKTVHDAMKRLVEQGILRSKRGRYGTYIMRKPFSSPLEQRPEHSMFASAEDVSFYNYEKIEKHLRQFISTNYKVGDKLPSMGTLATELKVSSNTIRKALQQLADDKIVSFSRGRYGGTFVEKLPEENTEKKSEIGSFTWLSVNSPSRVYQTNES
ncbi:MAG: GntR family transcriptional regulator [bacterium]